MTEQQRKRQSPIKLTNGKREKTHTNGTENGKVYINIDQLKMASVTLTDEQVSKPWLDNELDFVKVFTAKYGPEIGKAREPTTYYTLTEAGDKGLLLATDELHQLFVEATAYTLANQADIGKYFAIPAKLWPLIAESFEKTKDDVVSGRFDFAVTDDGLKVYEYNADSASCLMECGHTQDRWAEASGIDSIGRSNSDKLFDRLVQTWRNKKVQGVLHMLCDHEEEEKYHTLYMMAAAKKAGLKCKLIVGLEDISWTEEGALLKDKDGVVIQNIWKTWSWRTALNILSEQEMATFLENEANYSAKASGQRDVTKPPQLAHILFHPDVRVFEPLWTILPSCKSILPVLWTIRPNHPYLLDSAFELPERLKTSGYVAKPVTGRAGSNISMYKAGGGVLEETKGKWEKDLMIYQGLCMLPKYGGEYVQVCTWAVDGSYAGTVLRVDKSGIIGYESGVYALRVIP